MCVSPFPAGRRNFHVHVDRRCVLHVQGELDHATAPMLSAAIDPLTDRIGDVTIDVGGLGFIDAAGLRVLGAAARALGSEGSSSCAIRRR